MVLLAELRALWHARGLLGVLTRREFAARHAGTAAGALWPYLQPLLSIAAYYLVFDVVFGMRLSDQAPTRAVGAFLVVGALPWMAFCDALSRGMSSLLDAGGMLQKNALPVILFPARSVLASAIIYAPLLLLVALVYAPLHGFAPATLLVLPLLAMQMLLAFFLSYILAIMAAALRDTVQLVGFLLSVGIYLTPVLFPLALFPERWRWVLWFNPMTGPVIGYQAIFLQGLHPPLAVWPVLAAWILVAGVLLAVAIRRSRDQLVDWL